VVFDMATRFDLYRAGEQRYGYADRIGPDEDPDPIGVLTTLIKSDPEVRLRMTRMKYGMALLQYLHTAKVKAYSYIPEVQGRLTFHIPPGGGTMAESEVSAFVHHYKDHIFNGWEWVYDRSAPLLEKNAVDQHLVDIACENEAILISNEGLTHSLTPDPKAGIRRRAAKKAVRIFTSVDYLAHMGADARHLAQAAMMRIWYYFEKRIGRVPWARLQEYDIVVNWAGDESLPNQGLQQSKPTTFHSERV
jgi:hypothetical protein